MTARAAVLREAEAWAIVLRRSGYPEATVAPEYCIGASIGPDGFFTRTVSVWAGPHVPVAPRNTLKGLLAWLST